MDDSPLPGFMRGLLERAALLLNFHGMDECVTFPWWANGKEANYMARSQLQEGQTEPSVVVVRERSGEFFCRSLPGQPFDLDTSYIGGGSDEDELDRAQWRQRHRTGAGQ